MRAQAVGVSQFIESSETPVTQTTNLDAPNIEFARALHQATNDTAVVQKTIPASEDSQEGEVSKDIQNDSKVDVQKNGNKSLATLQTTGNPHLTSVIPATNHRPIVFEDAKKHAQSGQSHDGLAANPPVAAHSQVSVVKKTANSKASAETSEDGQKPDIPDAKNIPPLSMDTTDSLQAPLQTPKESASIQIKLPQEQKLAGSCENTIRTAKSAKQSFVEKKIKKLSQNMDQKVISLGNDQDTMQASSVVPHPPMAELTEGNYGSPFPVKGQHDLVDPLELLTTPAATLGTGKKVVTSENPAPDIKKEVSTAKVASNNDVSQQVVTPTQLTPSSPGISIASNSLGAVGQLKHSAFAMTAPAADNIPQLSGHVTNAKNLPAKNASAKEQPSLPEPGGPLLHSVLSATPKMLEVGVAGGTHGWLKIRAELTETGEVNASLTVNSNSLTGRLRDNLPELSSYLQTEKIQFNELSIQASPIDANTAILKQDLTSATGSAFNNNTDSGQQQQFNHQENGHFYMPDSDKERSRITFDNTSAAITVGTQMELGENATLSPGKYLSRGSWLNVQA